MDRRILLIAAMLVLPAATNGAGDAPLDRATLKGLKGVSVVVDTVDPELEKVGVTREAVLARLLARLQARHITIDPAATEFVGLRITAVRSHGLLGGTFALSMTLGLYQPVLLSRNHDVRTSTETWEVETVLMADSKILMNACTDSAYELSDRFAAAYLSVNPE